MGSFELKLSGQFKLFLFVAFLVFVTGCKKDLPAHRAVVNPQPDSPVTIHPDIVYTDVVPDAAIRANSPTDIYGLDLNNDGSVDFSFSVSMDSFQCTNQLGREFSVLVTPAPGNKIAIDDSYPSAMGKYETINNTYTDWSAGASQILVHDRDFYGVIAPPDTPGQPHLPIPPRRRQMPFGNGSAARVMDNDCTTFSIGKWQIYDYFYTGLRMVSSGYVYYGWVRLLVNIDSGSFTVCEYAYNRVPDQQILAGQTQ
jgi:hypothetical protein